MKMVCPRKCVRLFKCILLFVILLCALATLFLILGIDIKYLPTWLIESNVDSGERIEISQHKEKTLKKKEMSKSVLLNKLQEAAHHKKSNLFVILPVPSKMPLNLTVNKKPVDDKNFPAPNYNVHVFYYPWYGNPENDGKYSHWNHPNLPHWNPVEDKKWPKGQHKPPDDIGSNFYPELGPYSSADPKIIDNHMQQIRSSGAGTVAVSWYPPNQADEQGKPSDSLIPALLDAADKYALKVCLHIEPYKNRNAVSLKKNLEYIISSYGSHPAFYMYQQGKKRLPLYYVYDSYLIKIEEWGTIFRPNGVNTVRHTALDGIFIGLLVEEKHKWELSSGGFDGFYTYFASNGFSFGSTISNWQGLSEYAVSNDILFIPSVGPGYIDERIRPWNKRNTKQRLDGKYYENSFRAAVNAHPPVISVTSFNEWHEGSQIEQAVPKVWNNYIYLDYSPHSSDFYLMLTRKWSLNFKKMSK